MNPTEQARNIFAADRYATELSGIAIEHVGLHEAFCLMPLDIRHRNARGVAMGGALFTLADFAAAVAANSECLDDGNLRWVSLDATIHYLSPALGDRLAASAKAIKTGRSTALYQTTIENPDNGKTIAIVETTMMRIES